MLKIFLCTILAYFSLNTFARAAFAKGRGMVHEVVVHPTQAKIVLGDSSAVTLAVDYRRVIKPRWQVGGKFAFQQIRLGDGGQKYDVLQFGPGVAYNFGHRYPSRRYFAEAFYIFTKTSVDGAASDDNEQALVLAFGKRWPLSKRFTYRPQITYAMETADSDNSKENPILTIDALSVSYKF